MPFPYRAIANIRPLPSIFTTFPVHIDNPGSGDSSGVHSGTCLINRIEDGIEMVPFERSPQPVAPIWSPDQTEKEVLFGLRKRWSLSEKPLPNLPAPIWQRILRLRKTLVVLSLQFAVLLAIAIALLATRKHLGKHHQSNSQHAAAGDPSYVALNNRIQNGSYSVPLYLPQQQSSSCLANMNESMSWQCASGTDFQLSIFASSVGEPNGTNITIEPSTDQSLHIGHQIPKLQLTDVKLITAAGSTPGNAAYHFNTTYDHMVLIQEDDLPANDAPKSSSVLQNQSIQVGESLWRCIFNDTQIEGFIFIHQFTAADGTSNGTSSKNATAAAQYPKIPYVFKIMEQRKPNGELPYCEKVRVDEDGSLSNASSNFSMKLSEPSSDPSYELKTAKSGFNEGMRLLKKQETLSAVDCRCQWLIQ